MFIGNCQEGFFWLKCTKILSTLVKRVVYIKINKCVNSPFKQEKTMLKRNLLLTSALVATLSITACSQQTQDAAKDTAQSAVQDVASATDQAATNVQNTAESMGDVVASATDNTATAVANGTEAVKDGAAKATAATANAVADGATAVASGAQAVANDVPESQKY